MNPQPSATSRTPRHRFAVLTSYGFLLASSVCLLTACPQAAPPPSEPSPSPSPTAVPTALPTATPTPTVTQKYSGEQQMQYLSTARDGFLEARQAKTQPFLDAYKAFEDAGANNPKGLTSKEAVTARRALIAKCIETQAQYIDFARTQEDTYRTELVKTPLVPAEVDYIVKDFSQKANTPAIVKLRESQRDTLKLSDDMMATLEKSYGNWTVSDAGRLTFKKKSDVANFTEMSTKFNALVAEQEAARKSLGGTSAPVPSESVAPSPAPAAGATPASPAATASPSAASPAAKP